MILFLVSIPMRDVFLQLEAFASLYMSSMNKTDAANFSDYDLNYMGHFVCGLSTADIAKISNDVYGWVLTIHKSA